MNVVDDICADVSELEGDLGELVRAATRRRAPLASGAEQRRLVDESLARMSGLGELDAWVTDASIDEVLVNDSVIWIDRDGELSRVGTLTSTTTEQIIERILAPIGRRVDRTTPIVDARLADGSRVCAVVPPVSVNGATLSIRRFPASARTLRDFTSASGEMLCRDIVAAGANVVVSGATSSGKTSLLAALIATADPADRIVVLEDTAELPCEAPHLVRLEARPTSVEGLAPIPLGDLVRTALRLRPDRLVVGEVRSDEVLALVQAMNTGHDGSFSTCHANGPLDALLRLESLVLQAAPQWPIAAIRRQLARSIDVVVHVERHGARRRIQTIGEVVEPPDDRARPELRILATSDVHGDLIVERPFERRRR